MNTIKQTEYIVPGKEEWLSLVQRVVDEFDVGQLIPHDWLKSMFNIKPLDLKFFPDMQTVRKAIQEQQFIFLQLFERLRKDVLKSHNFYLVNVRGLGYKIINPRDQHSYAYDQLMDDIKSSFKECADIMTHTRQNHVDEEQRAKDRILFSKVGSLKQLFDTFRK